MASSRASAGPFDDIDDLKLDLHASALEALIGSEAVARMGRLFTGADAAAAFNAVKLRRVASTPVAKGNLINFHLEDSLRTA